MHYTMGYVQYGNSLPIEMFEQGLAFLLKRVLGEYVEEGNQFQDKIQLGVFSGLVVLENLTLKKNILDLIDVPLALRFGFIGSNSCTFNCFNSIFVTFPF